MALYVVGDVHGHLEQLTGELRAVGLVDDDGHWTGADAKLWFLGDLTDRGPDGIGVIDLVMRLQQEAQEAGGQVGCVIGNHDLLLYGSKHVPDSRVGEYRTMIQVWALNGGQESDLSGLTAQHSAWFAGLPAVQLVDDHLLIHADTTAYLEFGDSIDEINAAMAAELQEPKEETFGEQARALFRRAEFMEHRDGAANARRMLDTLGGTRIVHGHSTIPDAFGLLPSEVDGPVLYADGLVVAVDTGLALGARCIAVRLPLPE